MDAEERITRMEESISKLADVTEKVVIQMSTAQTIKNLSAALKVSNPFDYPVIPEPPEEPGPRYTVKGMSDAMRPQGEPNWVVKGLIERGNVVQFSAYTGTGKTWVMYYLATRRSLGHDFMEFETVPGTTLIVNEEMGERDLCIRLAMCNRASFGDENTPVKYTSFARFNLWNGTADQDAAAIVQAITETGADLVIIDALADLMQGGDENSVKDTQPVMMRLSDIAKKTDAAIVVIHHTGKNGQTRGSSAIPGAVDLAIKMERKEGSPFISFETEKARNIPYTKWVGKMTWTVDQFYIDRFYPEDGKPRLSEKEQRVYDFLENNGEPALMADITSFTGVSRDVVNGLIGKDVIERANAGGHGTKATYQLKVVVVSKMCEDVS